MVSFEALFSKYLSAEQIPMAIAGAEVINIRYDRKAGKITVFLQLNNLVERQAVFKLEDAVKASTLSPYAFTIKPHFTKELFNAEYYPQLVLQLKKSTLL